MTDLREKYFIYKNVNNHKINLFASIVYYSMSFFLSAIRIIETRSFFKLTKVQFTNLSNS